MIDVQNWTEENTIAHRLNASIAARTMRRNLCSTDNRSRIDEHRINQ